jgi:hypothetical protein
MTQKMTVQIYYIMENIAIKHATQIKTKKIVRNVIEMEFALLAIIINFLEMIAINHVKDVLMRHVL